jgi:hypothetical protein
MLHSSKNTYLPLKSKKCWAPRPVFQVFSLFMYSKRTFLTLEKIKKKKSFTFRGIFTWVFCVIKRVMGAFWYFSFFFYFLIEKLSASVPHASASGWRVWHHPAAKFGQPPSPPTRSRVIYTVWRALAYGGWIATGDRLFLFFLSFLSPAS